MTEIIIISVVIAIAAAVGVCVAVLKRYKSGLFSSIYPLEHYTRLNLTHREDRFLHRHVTRVRVQTSDSDRKR